MRKGKSGVARPKVVVIGAGSYFFGRAVIWNMTRSEVLRAGTLSLVDTNPSTLRTMVGLARRAVTATGAPLEVEGSIDAREVLSGADFVVLTFSDRNSYFRGMDCEIALRHGVRMCSGDTIGPGGIFRACREVPTALALARQIEMLAPAAWIINFVNPTTTLGIALMRFAPRVRSFAICDGLHEPYCTMEVLKAVGVLGEAAADVPSEVRNDLDLRIVGVNHFTWMIQFTYRGQNYLPEWRERLVRLAASEQATNGDVSTGGVRSRDVNAGAKARYNASYALQLMDIFGAYPDRISHTKEYMPYFQGYGEARNRPEPIAVFDAEERTRKMERHMIETEDYAFGRKPIAAFLESGRSDHATDIIESMWGGLGKRFYVNTQNRGAVANMADDAYLELRCDLDMDGPRPIPVGEMPRGLLGLEQQVLDTHELTAAAAATCDTHLLLRAMLVDPIINNIEDARAIVAEALERQRDALPDNWYR